MLRKKIICVNATGIKSIKIRLAFRILPNCLQLTVEYHNKYCIVDIGNMMRVSRNIILL